MFEKIFSSRAKPVAPPVMKQAPENADWHGVSPTGDELVRAWIAPEDCEVVTRHGVLKARKGEDVIVVYAPRDVSVVRKDLFNRTYKRKGRGLFSKRTDLKLRYFTLDHPVLIDTLEGQQNAAPGDWIVEGVDGELWPVPKDKAEKKYRRH